MYQLVRIDDRLVHGQVVVGWGSSLNFQRIIVCDSQLRDESWEVEIIKCACPQEISIVFLNEEELIKKHTEFENDNIKTIVLISDIQVLTKLAALNFPFNEINIGGIHYKDGRKQLLSYLYLSDEEKEHLKNITQKGYKLFAQDLPTNKKFVLSEIL